MSQLPQVLPHLPPAVPVVNLEVADLARVFKIAVVDHKGDVDSVAQLLVLIGAEA